SIQNGKNRTPTMRKPFDVIAEGLLSKNSRADKTAIKLFLSGVRALALQSYIVDVVRMFSGSSSATGGHGRSELAFEPWMRFLLISVDVADAAWRKCGSCGGVADRSALLQRGACRYARNCSASVLVPMSAPGLRSGALSLPAWTDRVHR